MPAILVYTFRTFPQIDQLKSLFGEVFVFDALKTSMDRFKSKVHHEKPDYILGIAHSMKGSFFEPTTINRFHGSKRIIADGEESYELFVPEIEDTTFERSIKSSDSFCNWTMYRLAESLNSQNIKTRLMFCHVNPSEIGLLKPLVYKLKNIR